MITRGISIIIPTYQRDDLLADTVGAIDLDSAEVPVEVFIVKDGGESGFTGPDERIECISIEHRGFRPSMLRNVAAGAAHYDQLVFLDDDCQPRPGWLWAYEQGFQENIILFGPIDYWTCDLSKKLTNDPRYRYGQPENWNVWTGNFSVSRAVYWRLGGLHPAFDLPDEIGEGAEFSKRAQKKGISKKILWDAAVRHRGKMHGSNSMRLQVAPNESREEYRRLTDGT